VKQFHWLSDELKYVSFVRPTAELYFVKYCGQILFIENESNVVYLPNHQSDTNTQFWLVVRRT